MQPTNNIKYIHLDSSNTRIAILAEGYEQIKQTIERYRACGSCGQLFTEENPQVTLNWCKNCFVEYGKGKRYGLTYLGMVSPERVQYSGIEHQFIAPDGYVYVTGSESEITHDMSQYSKNHRQTLKHWKFPALPETYEVNGEETRLHDLYISIYGDVRKDEVVFIEYNERHTSAPSVNLIFIAYRGAEAAQEFNKRKGEGRKLWLAGKARLEATKDARGEYHIGEYTRSWTYDSDIYYFIVIILNERATVKALEKRQEQATQPLDNVQPGSVIQLSLTAYEQARLQHLKKAEE